MGEEEVQVTIKPDGTVEVSVACVAGMSCLDETDELVQLLGGSVEAQELTAEAYLDVDEDQQVQRWS